MYSYFLNSIIVFKIILSAETRYIQQIRRGSKTQKGVALECQNQQTPIEALECTMQAILKCDHEITRGNWWPHCNVNCFSVFCDLSCHVKIV